MNRAINCKILDENLLVSGQVSSSDAENHVGVDSNWDHREAESLGSHQMGICSIDDFWQASRFDDFRFGWEMGLQETVFMSVTREQEAVSMGVKRELGVLEIRTASMAEMRELEALWIRMTFMAEMSELGALEIGMATMAGDGNFLNLKSIVF